MSIYLCHLIINVKQLDLDTYVTMTVFYIFIILRRRPFCYIIQLCSGNTSGRVLNGEMCAQRLQKLRRLDPAYVKNDQFQEFL